MAQKADGEVWIPVNIDAKNAQKKLTQLQEDIAKTQAEIEELQKETAAADERSVFSKSELDAEKAKLEEMRKTLAEMRSVANDVSFSKGTRAETKAQIPIQQEEVAAQVRRVQELEAEYRKTVREVEQYNAKLERAKKTLEAQEKKAGDLAEKMLSSRKEAGRLSGAMEQANKRMVRLTKRVNELVKSALLFSVITKGLTELKEWAADVIKSNDEARASIGRLKAALLTLVQPFVNVIIPALTKAANLLTTIVTVLARITAALFGTTVEDAKNSAEALDEEKNAITDVGNAAKKATKQLASFDEINRLSGETAANTAEIIQPDFSALDFELENLPDELRNIVLDIEAKIRELRFAWDNKQLGQSKDMWIIALTGILGAVIGGMFGGLSGATIGLLLGLSAGIISCTFLDKLDNADQAKSLFIVVLGAILGAVLGAKFGGLTGAVIGLLLGVLVSLISLEFAKGENSNWDEKDTIVTVLGGILGAILGAKFGGLKGAVIGFLLGASISFISISFSEGNYNKDEAIAALRTVIFAILGAVLGGWFGGPVGAAVGVVIGVVFSLFANTFDTNLSKSVREKTGKTLETVLETILGTIIDSQFGKIFGGIIGRVIKLVFGLLIDFDDVAIGGGGKANLGSGAGRSGRTELTATYSIPALAQGAVIPPNRQFLAMLGDNKTENEIVSPVSTMKQAFKEAVQEMGGFGGGELRLNVAAAPGFTRYLKFELDAENTRQGGRLVTNERLYT